MENNNVTNQICEIAIQYRIERVVLFGSRARGDHSPTSDYDIAVFGKNLSLIDKARFSAEVDEIETLKKLDLIFVDDSATGDLLKNIEKDGVILYEQ